MEFIRDWGLQTGYSVLFIWCTVAGGFFLLKTGAALRYKIMFGIILLIFIPASIFGWFWPAQDRRFVLDGWSYINRVFLLLFYPWLVLNYTLISRREPRLTCINILLFRPTAPRLTLRQSPRAFGGVLAAFGLFPVYYAICLGASPCGWFDKLTGYSGCITSLDDSNFYFETVKFSPDGKLLATSGGDYSPTVRLYNAADGQLVRELKEPTKPVYSLDFSPDGKLLAGSAGDDRLRIWQVGDGKLEQSLAVTSGNTISLNQAFSPDGQWLAASSPSNGLTIWRVSDWQVVKTFLSGRNALFTPDGRLVVLEKNTIQFWDPFTWTMARTLDGIDTYSPVFSPNGRLLAFSYYPNRSLEKAVLVYSATDGKLLYHLNTYGDKLAFSPDSRYLLTDQPAAWYTSTINNSFNLQLWDMANGKLVREFGYEPFSIDNLAYAPGGNLAWTSLHTIRLYRAP